MTHATEDKRREEQVTYLTGLLGDTEDAVVAFDAQWFVTVWNKGAERMYGWTADEVLGRRNTLQVARLEISQEDRVAIRCATGQHGRSGEVVASRKDGTPLVDVELITVALRGEQGEITGYLGIHRDVGERKRTERALRDTQRRSETILEGIGDEVFSVDREWRYTYVNEPALSQARRLQGRDLTVEDLLGKSCWEVLAQFAGTTFDHELHRALREQTVVEFEVLSAPSGRWLEVRACPSKDGLSVYSRDISARTSAQEELIRRDEQQALVAELGQRALTSDDVQALLDDAADLVARTLDIELTEVAELRPADNELLIRAGVGWRKGIVGSATEPAGAGSQAGYALVRDEAVVAEQLATERRFKSSPLVREHSAASAVMVSIRGRDEPFGALGALSTRPRTFSSSDVSFMTLVANVLATAVERRQAQERLAEVREVERLRIARHLHDEALQEVIYALSLSGRDTAATSEAEARYELTAALQRIGYQLRGAIYDLRLGGEERTPFPELLGALVAEHRAMAVDCEIELDLHEGIPAGALGATGIEVLRILGEALTNARRHAQARRVGVRVWAAKDVLYAEVCDDGHGFDPVNRSVPTRGHGIRGMMERASLLDGRLGISSDPMAGTTVSLEVPSQQDHHAAVEPVRVLLVEDHTAVREAIAAAFERNAGLQIVGQAASLAEARGMLEDVDVAVVDLGLPDGFGADLIKELHLVNPRAQALVLSATLDQAQIARAIQSGAAGALDKVAHLDEVVDAVWRLQAGETLLPLDEILELLRFAGQQRDREHEDRQAIAQLTPRERQVLQALADGLNSQQIADRLQIAIRTVRNHVASIIAKLGVHSQAQALVFALRYEVIGVR